MGSRSGFSLAGRNASLCNSNRFLGGECSRKSGHLLSFTSLAITVLILLSGPANSQETDAVPKFAAVAQSTEGVETIRSMRKIVAAKATAHQKVNSLVLRDPQWLDTGADVSAGETVSVTTSGSASLGDGRTPGPAGVARGWKDLLRLFPLNGAPVGALVGRVSDLEAAVPFLMGDSGQVTMPTNGRLFLRVNVSTDQTWNGAYTVHLQFTQAARSRVKAEVAELTLNAESFRDIPRRVGDKQGNDGDMVNFALIGTQQQVEAAFKAAGWGSVDQSVEDAILHGILSTMSHEAYTSMPMSTLYLFGRPQDLSFARADPLKVAAIRHHLRVWKSSLKANGVPVWVGSATHDVGFERDQRNGDVTHKIDPKIDDERDFLLKSFDAAGVFHAAAYITPEHPLRTAKTATGGEFFSDGRIVVMALD